MVSYNEYIDKLKNRKQAVDFNIMFSRVEQKINQRPRVQLILATAMVLIVVAFVGYYSYLNDQANDNLLMSYVFQQDTGDGPVAEYIFNDGTF